MNRQQKKYSLFYSVKSAHSMNFLNKLNLLNITKYFNLYEISKIRIPPYITKVPTILVPGNMGQISKHEGADAFKWLKMITAPKEQNKPQVSTNEIDNKTKNLCNEDIFGCGVTANTNISQYSSSNFGSIDNKTYKVPKGFGDTATHYGVDYKMNPKIQSQVQQFQQVQNKKSSSEADFERFKSMRDNDPYISKGAKRFG